MKKRVKRHAVVQPLNTSYRLIPLTRGKNAIIDTADYEWLSQWNWQAVRHGKLWYAVHSLHDEHPAMHQEITGFLKTDHRDGDGLNNRRSNLRPCSQSQNMANRKKPRTNTSGFKGVSWDQQRGKWQTHICYRCKTIALGRFTIAKDAARAYDAAARKLFGEFARTNFQTQSPST